MDQLREHLVGAVCDLLVARVEAERAPVSRFGTGVGAYSHAEGFKSERGALVADLDAAIENGCRALARAKDAPVIPLPLPHVARAAA
jgi:hypothetical protein